MPSMWSCISSRVSTNKPCWAPNFFKTSSRHPLLVFLGGIILQINVKGVRAGIVPISVVVPAVDEDAAVVPRIIGQLADDL